MINIIIIEGPDGSGKTTLISRLLQDLPMLELQPRVVSKDAEAMVDLQNWVIEDLQKGFGPRIYDRHRLISELIYGPVLRKTMEPGFDDWMWLSVKLMRLEKLNPIVILCLPPVDTVVANVMQSGDNKIVYDDITTIYWLYHIWHCQNETHLGQLWLWNYKDLRSEDQYGIMVETIRFYLTREPSGPE